MTPVTRATVEHPARAGWLFVALCYLASACSTGAGAVRVDAQPQPTPVALPAATSEPHIAVPGDAKTAVVSRVVDGDTIVLAGIPVGDPDRRTGGRRARLIGVDTPEVHGGVECLGREASAFTQNALNDKTVYVTFDVDTIDRYGRALVYVWQRNGTFFNGRLVAEGYALPFTVPPNVRYASTFVRLAGEARESRRGLWNRC